MSTTSKGLRTTLARIIATGGLIAYGVLLSSSASASSVGGIESITNQQRAANGLAPLTDDSRLDAAAANKAADMIANNYWAHTSPTGVTPWYWFTAAGYPYTYAGENLANGYVTDSAVVTAWMNSPEHRANILNVHYTNIGCGMATGMLQGINTTVTACEYGATASAPAAAQTPAATPVPTVGSTPVPTSIPTPAATPTPTPVPTVLPTQAPVPTASAHKPRKHNSSLALIEQINKAAGLNY